MAKLFVEGEMYASITGQLFEIGRQMRQKSGYPYNPEHLKKWLQMAVEGKFQFFQPRNLILVDYEPDTGYPFDVWKIVPSEPNTIGGHNWTSEEIQDSKSANLKEVDIANITLEEMAGPVYDPYGSNNTRSLTYCEGIQRIRQRNSVISLDARVWQALWKEKDHASLEWLRLTRGIKQMIFMGTVLNYHGPAFPALVYRDEYNANALNCDVGWDRLVLGSYQNCCMPVACVLASNI